MKLMMAGYDVTLANEESSADFFVTFVGPAETCYAGGVWKVHVKLPIEYPYKSPSLGFVNRMYHPNVDERSGSVCLDVINQTWSPLFDLVNIFEVFLPQLLAYPNSADPLNGEAAALQMKDQKLYEAKIRDYVAKYASGSTDKQCSPPPKGAVAIAHARKRQRRENGQLQASEAGPSSEFAGSSSAGASKVDDTESQKRISTTTTMTSVATSDTQLKSEDSMSELSDMSDFSDLSGDDELQHRLDL